MWWERRAARAYVLIELLQATAFSIAGLGILVMGIQPHSVHPLYLRERVLLISWDVNQNE